MLSLPAGWTLVQGGRTSARYRNEDYDLSVVISPRYRASASQRAAGGATPTGYRVEVEQDWFSRGVHGDRTVAAKADTREEADHIAREFMQEFVTERADQSIDDIESTHRSVGDAETAEGLLNTEAAAEALADSAGYSDDLLLDIVTTQTDGQFRLVAHRTGEDIEVVDSTIADPLETIPLRTVYAAFPVDHYGIRGLLTKRRRLTTVAYLDEFRVYRFIVADGHETAIVLDRGTQIQAPSFENTVWNVLEEKWFG